MRRGAVEDSTVASSGHISPRRSAISMNSRLSSLFTTFGGNEAAGLYGPGACSDSCFSDTMPSGCRALLDDASALAISSGPVGALPPAGVNVGSDMGSSAGFGGSPSVSVTLPAAGKIREVNTE